MIDFDLAFDRLIGNEGGYVNNPIDPGGETNWGISKRSYPNIDIRGLTRGAAKLIYLHDFWEPLGTIDDGVKFQVFDAAVNHGIQTAIRMMQRAAGVADDGHFGPMSQAAVMRLTPSDASLRFLAERLDFMRKLSTWTTFGAGWAGRIANDMRLAAQDT